MEFDVLIPARFAATRLPGKPLLEVKGKPLVQWVYESAKSSRAGQVIVATDDERILRAVESFGGEACMTRSSHRSGSDRIAEVVDRQKMPADRIVVNVQGDEPRMPGALIDQVAGLLEDDTDVPVGTACHGIDTDSEFNDPSVVKVVRDTRGRALYFSRAPIPWQRETGAPRAKAFRHIGIYAYRAGFLREFTRWPAAELELTEQLEQLRIVANGRPIAVCEASDLPYPGIDTPDDLERFRRWVDPHPSPLPKGEGDKE